MALVELGPARGQTLFLDAAHGDEPMIPCAEDARAAGLELFGPSGPT